MIWPPDYAAEYARRARKLHFLRNNPDAVPWVHAHYKDHPAEWINDWCVTYDPRNKVDLENPENSKPKVLPFMLFPRQVELVEFFYELYKTGENGLVEKCRDAGVSWIAVCFATWLWIYHRDSAIGFGSRKEEYVDKKGDPKALFPKIRQVIANLPDIMRPKGYQESVHATYMKIINPENASTVTGEAGDSIGRGGRTSIYFKDESAHYERPELIEAALGDNTNVQIDISSVFGTNNVFYRRRMAGEVWYPGHDIKKGVTRVFIFDWRDHPAKTQEWYDIRRERAAREGLLHMFAQEVDRDYSAAIQNVVIPAEWVNSAVDAHIKLGIEPKGRKIGMQDIADEGGDKHALAVMHGILLEHCEDWGEGDGGDAARKTVPVCKAMGVSELYYDSIGVGASFKTETNRMRNEDELPEGLVIQKWVATASPLDPEEHVIPEDENSPTNEEFFENLKAQAWWWARVKFKKTHEAVTKGAKYRPEELIAIPSTLVNLHKIKAELSQATFKTSLRTGKMVIDKKPDGGKSPNLADAIIGANCPTRELSIFDVL